MKPEQRLIAAGVMLALALAVFFGAKALNKEEEIDPVADNPLFEDTTSGLLFPRIESGEVVISFVMTDNVNGAVVSAELALLPTSGGDAVIQSEDDVIAGAEAGGEPVWAITSAPDGSDTGLGVDQALIRGSITSLPRLFPTNQFSEIETTLADFGLDPSQYTLEFTTSGGHTYTLLIGNTNPGGTSLYVQVEGDPTVYLVPTVNLDQLIAFTEVAPYVQPAEEETGETDEG